MKKIGFLLVFLLMVGTALSWDMKKPLPHTFVDSNKAIVLEVDSADFAGKTLHTDTTYMPSVHGYNFGWGDQLLVRYGISAIDGVAFPTGATESDSGHSLLFAVDTDSGHVGIALETSFGAAAWVIAWEDSTLRATTSYRSTNSHLMDVESMMSDTLIGGRARIRFVIYRDVDSTESDAYNIRDTVWLDRHEVWKFGFEE